MNDNSPCQLGFVCFSLSLSHTPPLCVSLPHTHTHTHTHSSLSLLSLSLSDLGKVKLEAAAALLHHYLEREGGGNGERGEDTGRMEGEYHMSVLGRNVLLLLEYTPSNPCKRAPHSSSTRSYSFRTLFRITFVLFLSPPCRRPLR